MNTRTNPEAPVATPAAGAPGPAPELPDLEITVTTTAMAEGLSTCTSDGR